MKKYMRMIDPKLFGGRERGLGEGTCLYFDGSDDGVEAVGMSVGVSG